MKEEQRKKKTKSKRQRNEKPLKVDMPFEELMSRIVRVKPKHKNP